MNPLDVAKLVGGRKVKKVLKGVELISAVNELIGKDALDEESTGNEVAEAIANLPPEVRSQYLAQKFELNRTRIEASKDVRLAMERADSEDGAIRPKIARGIMIMIGSLCLVMVVMYMITGRSGDPMDLTVWADIISQLIDVLAKHFDTGIE